jgi:hypothetical protein
VCIAGLPAGTTPPPHGKSMTASMEQLQIDRPPKPLGSGALVVPAASGAPNQQQAGQERWGDGMDFDDARSEISHPESRPDSESSLFSGNRGARMHATLTGSSRPCQPSKCRPDRVGGNDQAEIDRLLTQIVEEQRRDEIPIKNEATYRELRIGEVSSWTEIAERLNACDYIRESNLSKTSKYCRHRCDPLCVS